MSIERCEAGAINRERAMPLNAPRGKSRPDMPYCLSRYSRPRNKHITNSLHSLDVSPHSLHIPCSRRGRGLSHAQSEAKVVVTERGRRPEQSKRCGVMSGRSMGRERMHTIDEADLNFRERKLKESIEVMQGALTEIQNQKSQRRALQVKRVDNAANEGKTEAEGRQDGEKMSKFESYVKSLCKSKNDSKVVLIRKAKNKGALSRSESESSSFVRPVFDSKAVKPKEIAPISSLPRNTKPIFEEIEEQREVEKETRLEQIECSVIGKVSQGSFMSDMGKASLFRHLEGEGAAGEGNKALSRLKNHRKLKNLFPNGFF